jgi:hypothetical protein
VGYVADRLVEMRDGVAQARSASHGGPAALPEGSRTGSG